ncbi:hypothetical protein ES703_71036 [subsurface metagenome]
MSGRPRPVMRESLGALAEALIWAIEEYVKAGIDDMKGDGWTDLYTLEEIGRNVTHETRIFPEDTAHTITIAGHANPDEWSNWVEMAELPGGVTFSSKVTNIGHLNAINVEDTSASGLTWMLEIAYGDPKVTIARVRFISASIGNLPAIYPKRIRSRHMPSDEIIYARLMSSAAGADCKIHLRYYLH